MKTTKLVSALLMPAMFMACNDDVFEGVNLENELQSGLVKDLAIAVGIENGVESRGTFAEDATKGVFGKFYFEPKFAGNLDNSEVTLTNNTSIAGDQVGLCLPSAAANGNVVTNVPFYIAGYQTTPESDGDVAIHTLAASNDFYKFSNSDVLAFEETADVLTYGKFMDAVETLEAGTDLGEGVTNIQKAVFKSVSGVMKGDYVLYYPYKEAFNEQGKIPATELSSIQVQQYVDDVPTTAHVVGANMFAYAKEPFAVAGGKKEAKNMNMGTAAYIFQFKVYTTGTAPDNEIKMITVSTEDDAKAFGVKGYVTAGATNTFAADAATAVDLIGVRVEDMTVPVATAENYKTTASTAYLSTYAIPSQLTGKNIVVRLYDEEGNVATVTKAAGSAIKEGSTDYWKIDLKNVEFVEADRLVFDATDLDTELSSEPGTLILKNNIEATGVTIPAGFTINGANYSLTLGGTSNITGDVELNTTVKVVPSATLNIGNGTVGAANATDVTITTLENGGTLNIKNNATLNATTINNGVTLAEASATEVESTITIDKKTSATGDVDGKLVATTVNNYASAQNSDEEFTKTTGLIVVNGAVENTTINNANLLTFNAAMASTVTIDNDATLAVNAAVAGIIVNDKTMNVADGVKATGATITNNGTVNSAGIFTLSGATTFANNGIVNDNGVFSGLSRLENDPETGKIIRTVSALNNLNIALAEGKLTGIKINAAIAPEGEDDIVIETEKTLILAASLTLSTTEASSIKNIELAGGTLIGKVATEAIKVSSVYNNTTTWGIGANSIITVSGNITIAATKKLTAAESSYTTCDDIEGTYEGPIYVN